MIHRYPYSRLSPFMLSPSKKYPPSYIILLLHVVIDTSYEHNHRSPGICFYKQTVLGIGLIILGFLTIGPAGPSCGRIDPAICLIVSSLIVFLYSIVLLFTYFQLFLIRG